MSLNGSLCLKDAGGRIQLAAIDVTVPDGFNGGTPLTADCRLCVTSAIGLPLPRLDGLLYDTVGRLSITTVGPAVDWTEGLPLDANGRLFTSNIGAIVMHIPDGVPLTASGAVATTGAGGGGDVTPPTNPATLLATVNSDSQITLNWVASTDDTGVAGYSIERCTGPACTNFTPVGTSLTNSFVDPGLAASTAYRYQVRAYDAASNLSGYSNIANALTNAIPSQALADVVNITEGLALTFGFNLGDSLTVSDPGLATTPTKVLGDNLTVSDSVPVKDVSTALTDGLTVDDVGLALTPGRGLTDIINITEGMTFTPSIALGDIVGVDDSISFSGNGSASLSDSLTVSDGNLTFSVSTVLGDSLTLTDPISFGVTLNALADSLTITEGITLTPTKVLGDSLTISDAPPTMSVTKPLTDSLTVDDNVISKDFTKGVLTDSLTVSDSLVAGLVFSTNLSDSLTVSDNLTPTYTPGPTNETIKYVGGQVANRAGATSTLPVTFALTGTANPVPLQDDLVIVTSVVASSGTNGAQAIVTPAGYTALGQLNQAAATNDVSMNVSYKFMGSTPDTSVTIPACVANTDGQAYTIQVFRNVDKTAPMDVAAVSAGGTGTGQPNPGSITPVTPGAMIVTCGAGAAATGANYLPPPGYTNSFLTSFGADNFDAMVGSGYSQTPWASGAVDPPAYTGGTTNAADSWAAYTLALRPAAGVAHSLPGDLFAAGELGGWWDPSDFSTMFLDTAGTAAVTTAGQAVARINDKSGRGNHLLQAATGSRPTIDCRVNKINVSEDLTSASWPVTAGSVTANALAGPSGIVGSMAEGIVGNTVATLHYVEYALPNVANAREKNCYSVYVHAGQAGALGGMALIVMSTGGSEMRCGINLTNGIVTQEFNTFTGTSDAFGVEPVTADGWYRIWISGNLDTTTTTRVMRLMVRNTSAQAGVACDGTSIQFYATGVQVEPGIGPPSKYQRVDSSSSYDTSGFPWYLNFDGVDDFMSAALDFSTVSKVALWAGVLKGSDVNFGSCVGLTADPTNTAGSFHLTAPDSAGSNNYGWGSRGNVTSASAATALTIPAADLSVISTNADIAADVKILRRNGAQAATSSADQGTGNYANSTLYVGERGGTQFPFTGRLYGLIVRGAATQATAAQIRDLEQWMAGKTGITFP